MRRRHTILVAGVLLTLASSVVADAQQATIGNRFHTLSDSFFEQNSISWSGNYRGISFAFGNGLGAAPAFGSPNTASGLGVNFGIAGKNGQINFALNFAQGDKRADVTQAPEVTVMNGQTGYFSDTSQTPFVVGAIPVVGGFPVAPQMQPPGLSPDQVDPRVQALLDAQAQAKADAQGGAVPAQPAKPKHAAAAPAPMDAADAAGRRLDAAQASTAGRPAVSVAEARRLHDQEQAVDDGQMAALMVRAQALEEDGQSNVAKIYYQRIAKHATGELQRQARTRLYELQGKP